MWDPNTWVLDQHEHRIYADETLEVYAVVDAIDYPYLSQFRWSLHTKLERGVRGNRGTKKYLRRAVSTFHGPDGENYVSPIHGHVVRNRNRTTKNLFLHQAVMERKGDKPPTPAHKYIDHIDQDSMNCRRENLEWETKSGNTLNNRNGKSPKVLRKGRHR